MAIRGSLIFVLMTKSPLSLISITARQCADYFHGVALIPNVRPRAMFVLFVSDVAHTDRSENSIQNGQLHFPLGMNPGTPVSTTALNLIRDLIPSLISRMASSGRVETS